MTTDFNASEHVSGMPYVGDAGTIHIGSCPECDYQTGKNVRAQDAIKALSDHWEAKHAEGDRMSKKTEGPALQGVVVPVDNRNSAQRVQDACFEGLIRDYTAKEEWNVLEMINLLYGKVLTDREDADV